MTVVAKAEFAQSYSVQARMRRRYSLSFCEFSCIDFWLSAIISLPDDIFYIYSSYWANLFIIVIACSFEPGAGRNRRCNYRISFQGLPELVVVPGGDFPPVQVTSIERRLAALIFFFMGVHYEF